MFSPSPDYRSLGASPSSPGSEPMNLGSPVSSPTSHNNSVNFLPPYLIRDVSSNSPSLAQHSGGGWSTPVKQSNSFVSSQLSPVSVRKTLYDSPASNPLIGSPSVTKACGPPVQSLFDSVASPKPSGIDFNKNESNLQASFSSLNGSQLYNGVLSPSKSFAHNTSSCMSPAQIDPFYTQGEALTSSSQLDETWVTVFGFPPAATPFILQQFSQYGKIIDNRLATSGNWIHIRYQSKLQAKKAISKTGKIFGENIMVGVKPCIDMDIMNEPGKENSALDMSANFCQESINSECFDSTKRSLKNIRPLTQIYKSPNTENEVTPTKVQPRVNSLMSRAMEYVLKW